MGYGYRVNREYLIKYNVVYKLIMPKTKVHPTQDITSIMSYVLVDLTRSP